MSEVEVHLPDVVVFLGRAALRQEVDAAAVGRPHGRQVVAGMEGELGQLGAVGADGIDVGITLLGQLRDAAARADEPMAVG